MSSLERDVVTRIDPDTNRIEATITVGPLPREAAPGDDAFLPGPVAVGEGAVWVVTARGAAARIDLATNRVEGMVELSPAGPSDVAAGVGAVWVTESFERGSVGRIDAERLRVEETIPVGRSASQVAVTGESVWVSSGSSPGEGAVHRIDPRTNAVEETVHLGPIPTGVAGHERSLWVAWYGKDGEGGELARIDATTGETLFRAGVGNDPFGIASVGQTTWVINSDDDLLRVELGTNNNG